VGLAEIVGEGPGLFKRRTGSSDFNEAIEKGCSRRGALSSIHLVLKMKPV
jgi:hypothetical protein